MLPPMAYISTIPPDPPPPGRLGRIYAAAMKRAGRVFNILRVQSQRPETLEASLAMYQAAMFAPSSVTRAEREMIAVVVSRANDCFY